MPVIKIYGSKSFFEELGDKKVDALSQEWTTALATALTEPEEKIAVYWIDFYRAFNALPLELHIDYEGDVVNAVMTTNSLASTIGKTRWLERNTEVGIWPLFGGKPFLTAHAGSENPQDS